MNFLLIITTLIIIGVLYKPVTVLLYRIIPSLTETKNAKVIYREIWKYGEYNSAGEYNSVGALSIIPSDRYCITFEFDDLKEVTLEVPEIIYNRLRLGNKGILKYHEKTFVKFKVIEW
ncbi:MAG: DUF2500 domain-containing protein [Oscillospiraceae bacterium]|nr:DUF2500 domain-containing protein [Oscillospiraceae bacterium]